MKLINRIYRDLKYSAQKVSSLHRHIKEDFKFEQGKQWEDADIAKLREAGVKALTINKIKPIIRLVTGLERQSKSDYKAFPEGGEDELTSQIVTRLMKNIVKNSNAEMKMSELFEHGAIGGMSFVEGYIDYTFDLINGDMKFRKISALDVWLDPDFKEYDLSDAKYMIKVTKDLSKDDLLTLFPDEKKDINKLGSGKINWDNVGDFTAHIQGRDYPEFGRDTKVDDGGESETYDLIDYYYKEMMDRYYVIASERGIVKEFETEEEAKEYATGVEGNIMKRKVSVIKLAQAVCDLILYDDVCPTYPRWRTYPIIPFFAELITEDLDDFALRVQGIVRVVKDLQLEFNKRRTQELRHLNASTNSGWKIPKGSVDDDYKDAMKAFGSSPGFIMEYDPNKGEPQQIFPTPLSQGHAQLAAENVQDLKEASGVNPDLLANDSQSQSGRAILFKQRQGLVMVQSMLDNFLFTKRQIGRFILSQFKELFTIESAMRVLGDAFIADNYTVPVNIILERSLKKVEEGKESQLTELENATLLQYPNSPSDKPIVDENNNLVTAVDFDTAIIQINNILNETQLNKYDVALGEGPYQDTIRLSNFMDIKELAQQGVPIPPDVLIELSMIPASDKRKILQQLRQQALVQQKQAQQEAGDAAQKGEE